MPQSCKWVVYCMNLIDCMNLWWFNQEFQITMIKTIKGFNFFLLSINGLACESQGIVLNQTPQCNFDLLFCSCSTNSSSAQVCTKHWQCFLFSLMASWHECFPFQQYHGIALLSFYVRDITKLCYIGQSWFITSNMSQNM